MIRSIVAIVAFLSLTLPAWAQSPAQMPGASTMSSMTLPQCKAGDPVVWINTHSNVYYRQGTKYYAKTSHGRYACLSAAKAAGNHGPRVSAATGRSLMPNQGPGTTSQ